MLSALPQPKAYFYFRTVGARIGPDAARKGLICIGIPYAKTEFVAGLEPSLGYRFRGRENQAHVFAVPAEVPRVFLDGVKERLIIGWGRQLAKDNAGSFSFNYKWFGHTIQLLRVATHKLVRVGCLAVDADFEMHVRTSGDARGAFEAEYGIQVDVLADLHRNGIHVPID